MADLASSRMPARNWITILVATGCAWAIGFFMGSPSVGGSQQVPASGENVLAPGSAQHVPTRSNAAPTEEHHVPADLDVRARTLQILSIIDELERIREFSAFLPKITERNWQDARAAFVILGKEGRGDHDAHRMLMKHIGRVGRREAMEELLKSGGPPSRFGEVLEGWASADPEGAANWVAAPGREQQEALISWLAIGTLERDPKKAIRLLYDQRPEFWDQQIGTILARTIQQHGFAAADELYSYVRADSAAPSDGAKEFLTELAMRRAAMGIVQQDAAGMLAWFDPHFPLGTANGDWLVTTAAPRVDPAQTLAWVDARSDRMNSEQTELVYGGIAKEWAGSNAKSFEAWLNTNPTHPLRDLMVGAAAFRLAEAGRTAEAMALNRMISDPTRRAQSQRGVKELEAAGAKP